MATADRNKDDFFEDNYPPEDTRSPELKKEFLKGQLQVIDDIVGLVAFMQAFKEAPKHV